MNRILNLYFLARVRFFDLIKLYFSGGEFISIVRKIQRPPYGGGNQFCLALHASGNLAGMNCVFNIFSNKVSTYLVDGSYISDSQIKALLRIKQIRKINIIHRIDGPTYLYKGDEAPDIISYEINSKLADITIFQSKYTKKSYEEMGYFFCNPTVILNGYDSRFFYSINKKLKQKTTKLIITSWSDNKKKGQNFLEYIDRTFEKEKYHVTFVGRTKAKLINIKVVPPVGSAILGNYLREADIYLALSQNDPCSNALCDALGCNIPVVYLNSGGHPELVGSKGVAINDIDGLWDAVDEVRKNLSKYRSIRSNVKTMNEVFMEYFSLEKVHC